MDRKKLAIIHIVKKELNLSDDEYRDILHKAAGINSAKDLDEEKFKKLMNYFVRSTNTFGLTIRQKLYIQILAQDIGWNRSHLNNFAHKYHHKSDVGHLSKEEAIKVIEALKNIKQHQK